MGDEVEENETQWTGFVVRFSLEKYQFIENIYYFAAFIATAVVIVVSLLLFRRNVTSVSTGHDLSSIRKDLRVFDSIDDDICCHIFNYLAVDDLVRVSGVAKRFFRIARSTDLNHYSISSHFTKKLQDHNYASDFWESLSKWNASEILKNPIEPNSRLVSLRFQKEVETANRLERVDSVDSKYRSRSQNISSSSSHHSDTAKSSGWESVSDKTLWHLSKSSFSMQLKGLSLAGCNISDRGVQYLRSMTNLERLQMKACDISDGSIESISSLPKLRYLSLKDCAQISDGIGDSLLKLSTLQSLDLRGCYRITDECISKLIDHVSLAKLRVLRKRDQTLWKERGQRVEQRRRERREDKEREREREREERERDEKEMKEREEKEKEEREEKENREIEEKENREREEKENREKEEKEMKEREEKGKEEREEKENREREEKEMKEREEKGKEEREEKENREREEKEMKEREEKGKEEREEKENREREEQGNREMEEKEANDNKPDETVDSECITPQTVRTTDRVKSERLREKFRRAARAAIELQHEQANSPLSISVPNGSTSTPGLQSPSFAPGPFSSTSTESPQRSRFGFAGVVLSVLDSQKKEMKKKRKELVELEKRREEEEIKAMVAEDEKLEKELFFEENLQRQEVVSCLLAADNDPGTQTETYHDSFTPPAKPAPTLVRVLFDFNPEHESDLSIYEGDVISVISAPDSSDWWSGQLNGVVGNFPANYVEVTSNLNGPLSPPFCIGDEYYHSEHSPILPLYLDSNEYREWAIHREKVITELLDTEQSYTASLNSCISHFLEPFEKRTNGEKTDIKGVPLIDSNSIKKIFGNMRRVLEINTDLCRILAYRCESWDENSMIGDVFEEFGPFLQRPYIDYVLNYSSAIKTLCKLEFDSSSVAKYLSDARAPVVAPRTSPVGSISVDTNSSSKRGILKSSSSNDSVKQVGFSNNEEPKSQNRPLGKTKGENGSRSSPMINIQPVAEEEETEDKKMSKRRESKGHTRMSSWSPVRKNSNSGPLGLDLRSLLIMPVQRIPRYLMLLQDLKKHLPPGHPDWQSVNGGIEILHDIASTINETKRLAEEMDRVLLLQECTTGELKENLLAPKRRLCKEKEMTVINPAKKSTHQRIAFIFSDLLLLVKNKSKKRPTGGRALSQWRPRYDLKDIFVFDKTSPQCFVRRCDERTLSHMPSISKYSVEVLVGKVKRLLCFDSEEEASDWYELIQEAANHSFSQAIVGISSHAESGHNVHAWRRIDSDKARSHSLHLSPALTSIRSITPLAGHSGRSYNDNEWNDSPVSTPRQGESPQQPPEISIDTPTASETVRSGSPHRRLGSIDRLRAEQLTRPRGGSMLGPDPAYIRDLRARSLSRKSQGR